MSGADYAARALALSAMATQPVLFTALSSTNIPLGVDLIRTSGFDEVGKGQASFVSDSLCDVALLAAHPAFVAQTANGRIFRLLPEAGRVTVEQGGATGAPEVNDQPAIQATIDYAEAIGAAEVCFGSEHYELWCPQRISHATAKFAPDGHPIVIRRSLILRGAAANRTTIDLKGLGGADPESSWQIVEADSGNPDDAVWRGGGIFVLGDQFPPPADLAIDRIELHRLVIRGNRQRTGNSVFPASIADGDGWDITDKGFWLQDTLVGDIVLKDTDLIGFKGEIFYLAGYSQKSLELERVRILTSNGNAFNPGVDVPLKAIDCEFGDAFQAQEDTGKSTAQYRGCLWRDCVRLNIGGGPTNGIAYNYLYPTRDETTQPPITQFDGCEFRNIGQVLLGSWVRGDIRTTDSLVILSGDLFQKLNEIDLVIDAWLDQENGISPFALYGPVNLTTQIGGAPAGEYVLPPQNIQVRLRYFRTSLAKNNDRHWGNVQWGGYIDRSCRIVIEGAEAAVGPFSTENPPISFPFVELRNLDNTVDYIQHGANDTGAIDASGVLQVRGPTTQAYSTIEGVFDLTLPTAMPAGPQFGFAEGQRLRLYKNGETGTLRFVKNASPGFAVQQTRTLEHNADWIEFTFNRAVARWEESGFFAT